MLARDGWADSSDCTSAAMSEYALTIRAASEVGRIVRVGSSVGIGLPWSAASSARGSGESRGKLAVLVAVARKDARPSTIGALVAKALRTEPTSLT